MNVCVYTHTTHTQHTQHTQQHTQHTQHTHRNAISYIIYMWPHIYIYLYYRPSIILPHSVINFQQTNQSVVVLHRIAHILAVLHRVERVQI